MRCDNKLVKKNLPEEISVLLSPKKVNISYCDNGDNDHCDQRDNNDLKYSD